jgi:hypothetical protein
MWFEVSSIFFHATPGKVTCSIISTDIISAQSLNYSWVRNLSRHKDILPCGSTYTWNKFLFTKRLKIIFPADRYSEIEGILKLKYSCSSCVLQCQAEQLQIRDSYHAMHIFSSERCLAQILNKLSGTSLRTKLRKSLEILWFVFFFIYF